MSRSNFKAAKTPLLVLKMMAKNYPTGCVILGKLFKFPVIVFVSVNKVDGSVLQHETEILCWTL
jgi:hypothetical protein